MNLEPATQVYYSVTSLFAQVFTLLDFFDNCQYQWNARVYKS